MPRSTSKGALERLQERIRTADRGWFFAAVADQVAERRQQRGLSQRELAELVGTTQSAIARLERGGQASAHRHAASHRRRARLRARRRPEAASLALLCLLDDSSRQVALANDDVAVGGVDDVLHLQVLVAREHDEHVPGPVE